MTRANDKEMWCENQPRLLTFVVTGALLLVSVFAEYTMACCVTDVDLYVRKAPTDPWGTSVTVCADQTVYFKAECQVDEDPDECRPIHWQFNFQDGYVTDLYTYSSSSGPCTGTTFSKTTSHAYHHGSDWEPSVTVERQGAGCASKQATCQVRAVEVEIEAFDRVPPTQPKNVQVTVTPSGDTIQLDVIRTAGTSGSATVSPSSITSTTTVTVTGGEQTSVGNPDNLSLRAKLDSSVCDSEAFSVCAHPTGYEVYDCTDLGPENPNHYGLCAWYEWDSDSGTDGHLDKCKISEDMYHYYEDSPPFYLGGPPDPWPPFYMDGGFAGDVRAVHKDYVHDYTDGWLTYNQDQDWECERCNEYGDLSMNDISHHVYDSGGGDYRIGTAVGHSCPGVPCFQDQDIVE